jgi:hypothetical protein
VSLRGGGITASPRSTGKRLRRSTRWLIEDSCRTVASAAEGPVRVAVATVTVPMEVARTSLNILRLTEELLEEVVFLLRSIRPVVSAVNTSRQADQFDTVLGTVQQVRQSADAITRTPIRIVRSVLTPARASQGGSSDHIPVIDEHGQRVPAAEHLLQTPTVVVRIASISVSMPSIAVGTPSRSLRLPGLGQLRPRGGT